MVYNMNITFGHYVNSEDELESKIFSPNATIEIKRDIFVEYGEEILDNDDFKHYYFGYVSYENISKQNIKDILHANNENECWTIFENDKIILTDDNDKSVIEQWLNEQVEPAQEYDQQIDRQQNLHTTKKRKHKM